MQNGNPVGSLSEIQKSLIEGCLLGDGYMRCKTNAHLEVNHSIHQKEYVDWKYQHLREFILTPPKARQGNGRRIGYRFFTRSLPIFTDYFHRYYKNGVKVIPKDVCLNPMTIAVWFMDDGSKSQNSMYLNTQKYTSDEQEYLMSVLKSQYNLQLHLDRDKQYTRLRFPVADSRRLKDIIYPFILPSLQYKFPV